MFKKNLFILMFLLSAGNIFPSDGAHASVIIDRKVEAERPGSSPTSPTLVMVGMRPSTSLFNSQERFVKAAEEGDVPTLTSLARRPSVNINGHNKAGETARNAAGFAGKKAAVEYLDGLEGLDTTIPNKDGKTFLMQAIRGDHRSLVSAELKSKDAGLGKTDEMGASAATYAVTEGTPAVTKAFDRGVHARTRTMHDARRADAMQARDELSRAGYESAESSRSRSKQGGKKFWECCVCQ